MKARRTGLHVILRVEMRARGIGRAYGVHNGQMARVEHGLERSERGVQAEESVQIDGRVRSAIRLGYSDGRPQFVIARFSKRDHHVQAVHCATLKNCDQNLLAGVGRFGRVERARKPHRHGADSEHGERGTFEENTSGRHICTTYLFWKSGDPITSAATSAGFFCLLSSNALSMAARVSFDMARNISAFATALGSSPKRDTFTFTLST